MDIQKALSILNIDNIDNIDETKLKIIFRKLMKKNHPDLGGSEEKAKQINNAYEIITNSINNKCNIPKEYKETKIVHKIIMSIDSLINIYSGKSVYYNIAGKKVEINKNNLKSNDVILDIEVKVLYRNKVEKHTTSTKLNIKDYYIINIELNDSDLKEPLPVELIVSNKKVKLEMSLKILEYTLTLDKAVKLRIRLERKENNG